MAALQYTLNDYIGYILISSHKRLLVEGPDDSLLFNRLLDIFDKERNSVDVDDASQLIEFEQVLGNREKVERVCQIIDPLPCKIKIVGFVDREFREFEDDPELKDNIRGHNVSGRLIWSRGHSIENYFFDFANLKGPIADHSSTPYYRNAIAVFEEIFEESVRLACALSLVGREIGNLDILKTSVSWETLSYINNKLELNMQVLERTLRGKKFPIEEIQKIGSRYPVRLQAVQRADFDIVRWMCHGHIGFAVIVASIRRIVYETSRLEGAAKPEKEAAHTLETNDEIRKIACANQWIKRSMGNEDIFPFEILQMLDLPQV